MNPANSREEASEGESAQGEEGCGCRLSQELNPVVHAHQVIGYAHKEKQHSAHAAALDAQERAGVARLYLCTKDGHAQNVEQENAHHRKWQEADAPQPGNGYWVHFAVVRRIHEVFLLRDADDSGHNECSHRQGEKECGKVYEGHRVQGFKRFNSSTDKTTLYYNAFSSSGLRGTKGPSFISMSMVPGSRHSRVCHTPAGMFIADGSALARSSISWVSWPASS